MEVVGKHRDARDIPSTHRHLIVDGDRCLVFHGGRNWNDGHPGGGRLEAVRNGVVQLDLFFQRGCGGDPNHRVIEHLHREPSQRTGNLDRLYGKHAPARRDVIVQDRDSRRLAPPEIPRILHRDRRERLGRVLCHVDPDEANTRGLARPERVLQVVAAGGGCGDLNRAPIEIRGERRIPEDRLDRKQRQRRTGT